MAYRAERQLPLLLGIAMAGIGIRRRLPWWATAFLAAVILSTPYILFIVITGMPPAYSASSPSQAAADDFRIYFWCAAVVMNLANVISIAFLVAALSPATRLQRKAKLQKVS